MFICEKHTKRKPTIRHKNVSKAKRTKKKTMNLSETRNYIGYRNMKRCQSLYLSRVYSITNQPNNEQASRIT